MRLIQVVPLFPNHIRAILQIWKLGNSGWCCGFPKSSVFTLGHQATSYQAGEKQKKHKFNLKPPSRQYDLYHLYHLYHGRFAKKTDSQCKGKDIFTGKHMSSWFPLAYPHYFVDKSIFTNHSPIPHHHFSNMLHGISTNICPNKIPQILVYHTRSVWD